MAVRGFEKWGEKGLFQREKLAWLFRLLWESKEPISSGQIKDISAWEYVDGIKQYHKGLSSVQLREMVHFLRTEFKFPITSSTQGYGWAHTAEEMQTTLDHLIDRANSILDVHEALNDANYDATPFSYAPPSKPGEQGSLGANFGDINETLGDIAKRKQ